MNVFSVQPNGAFNEYVRTPFQIGHEEAGTLPDPMNFPLAAVLAHSIELWLETDITDIIRSDKYGNPIDAHGVCATGAQIVF